MPLAAPAWRWRIRAQFLLAVVAWGAAFRLVARDGDWTPLAALGPSLAALALATQPRARALLRADPRLLLLGVASAAALICATVGLFHLGVLLVPGLRAEAAGLYRLLGAPGLSPWQRALLLPLVAAAEEVVFRGAVLPGAGDPPALPGVPELPAPEGPPSRALWTAPSPADLLRLLAAHLALALAYLPSGRPLLGALAFACGLGWGLLRIGTGSVVPSLVCHVLWDLVLVVAWPLA